MSASPEQRHAHRVPISYKVRLVAGDQMISYASARNLSMGGILLGGRQPLPVGSLCGVAILLADSEAGRRIVARGTVVRNDERGMAIAFSQALGRDSEEALRLLLESLQPLGEDLPGVDHVAEPDRPEASDSSPEGRPGLDPEAALANLMDRIKPGSVRPAPTGGAPGETWEPPVFDQYEDIRHWLKESVLSATTYERYPDGRWTIQLLLKEQNPGTYRYIVL